jgi:hypothetical protein
LLIDAYSDLSFGNFLSPELHQQNALVMVNAKTLKLEKCMIRDLDGVFVDIEARELRGLVLRPDLKREWAHQWNKKWTIRGIYENYLRRESLQFLFGGAGLQGIRPQALTHAADRRLLSNANRILKTKAFHAVKDLDQVHQILTEPTLPDAPPLYHCLRGLF